MAYTRRTWVPEQTALSADNFNNIEEGIVEAKAAANGNETMWTFIRNKISSVLGLTDTQYNGNAATATDATHATNADNATNADTVNNHTVASDVPANAVFTDTTYSDATTGAHGLMTAADKTKLNGIATGATNNPNSSIVNLIYPVGSIYTSVNSTSPATLFGGTWERIQGRFLVAAGSNGASGNEALSVNAGTTGGEKVHLLTASESGQKALSISYLDYQSAAGHTSMNSGTSSSKTVLTNLDTISVNRTASVESSSASSAHNTLPPYLAVYMWKRTA